MSIELKLVTIGLLWLVAALTLFGSGMFVGQTNRYDDCELVTIRDRPARVCWISDPVEPIHPANEGSTA